MAYSKWNSRAIKATDKFRTTVLTDLQVATDDFIKAIIHALHIFHAKNRMFLSELAAMHDSLIEIMVYLDIYHKLNKLICLSNKPNVCFSVITMT